MNIQREAPFFLDSGWRTDTSSNTGSLGRSNPWGTFSEEDSSEKDSLKQLTDTDSLLSQKDESLGVSELGSVERPDIKEFLTDHDAQMLHQSIAVSSVAKEETLPTASALLKSNSFSKYLINNIPNKSDNERSLLDELMSDSDEKPSPLHRPLSQISDDVFAGDEPVCSENTEGILSSDESRDELTRPSNRMEPQARASPELRGTALSQNSSPLLRTGSRSPESDLSSSSSLVLEVNERCEGVKINEEIDERPKSVNFPDLNIYIPGPPKEPTRAISPSELVIPSPPLEFADSQEAGFSYQFIDEGDKDSSTESSDNSTSSSPSSSSDVVEFMVNGGDNIDALKISSAVDGDLRLGNEELNDDEVVEFMKPESNHNVRLYEETNPRCVQNHTEDGTRPSERTEGDKDKSDAVYLSRKFPSFMKSASFNENDRTHYQRLKISHVSAIRDENARRQSDPFVPSLTLPRSPGVDLKKERIMSPLFFSAENESLSPKRYHFRSHSDIESKHFHFKSPVSVDEGSTGNYRLTLPDTPTAIRRSQYHSLCSTESASNSDSLSNIVSYDEFSEYLDACKTAITKSLQLVEQMDSVIRDSKSVNGPYLDSEDPEKQSYVDVIGTCARSLSNKTKELVSLSTSANTSALHRFLRSSQNEVQSMVVAIVALEDSTTLANLVKDVVREYAEMIKCLKNSTAKPLTDPDVVRLIEKISELAFSSTILIRGLKSN